MASILRARLDAVGTEAVSGNLQIPLSPEMAQIYNKIVVVAEDQTIPDYPVQTAKFEFWLIEGPHRKSLDTTRETRELIKQKVLGLTKR